MAESDVRESLRQLRSVQGWFFNRCLKPPPHLLFKHGDSRKVNPHHRHKHLVMFEKVAESLYSQTKRQFGGDFTSSKAKSTALQGTDRFRDRHRLFVIKINRRITDIWNRTTFKNDQITITCDVQHIR